jgi:hypothetical protein
MKQSVAQLEELLAAHAPELAKTAPSQLKLMKGLVRELKAAPKGKAPSAAAQKSMRALFTWQLDLKRAALDEQLKALEPLVAAKNAAAVKADRVLQEFGRVIDQAKKTADAAPGDAKALAALDAAAERARKALKALETEKPAAGKKPAAPGKLAAFKAPFQGSALSAPGWNKGK